MSGLCTVIAWQTCEKPGRTGTVRTSDPIDASSAVGGWRSGVPISGDTVCIGTCSPILDAIDAGKDVGSRFKQREDLRSPLDRMSIMRAGVRLKLGKGMDSAVALIVPGSRNTGPIRGVVPLIKYLVRSGVRVDVIALSVGDGSDIRDALDLAGAATCELRRSRFRVDGALRDLYSRLSGGGYRVAHSTGFRPDLYLAMLRDHVEGLLIVSTVRSRIGEEWAANTDRLRAAAVRCVWTAALKRFHRVVPHSFAIHDALLEYGVPPDRMTVVANGVDLESYNLTCEAERVEMKRELSISESAPVIGYVGRLTRLKRVDLLIEAAALIVRGEPHLRLLIVGEGEERTRLEALAKQRAVENQVVFTGSVADPRRLLKAMDVFCLVSATEGLSRSLLEAGATGLPAVVSNIPACREVVQDGVNGHVLQRSTPIELSQCLRSLFTDLPRARNLGARMRAVIVDRFSAEKMAEGYRVVYSALAKDGVQ